MATNAASPTPIDACWDRVGVQGDRSCPRLAEAVHCRNCPVFSAEGQRLFDRQAPAGYYEEWTGRLAETDRPPAETRAVLVFRIGEEWLALDVQAAVEAVEPRVIQTVPHRSDRVFLGVVNIRGEIQLCVSLRELLGIEAVRGDEQGAASERFLVVDDGRDRWVLPVDEVEGVRRVPVAGLGDVPDTVARSGRFCSEAVCCQDGKTIGLLSPSRLFQALERSLR